MVVTRVLHPVAWTVLAVVLAAPGSVEATVTTLVPTDDSYVRGGPYAGDNYDSDARLRVKNGSGSDNDREALLRFDVSGVQGTVVSATLALYCNGLSNGTPTSVFVHSVAIDSWKEDVVTWNTAPAAVAVLASRGDITTIGQTYTFDVTGFVTQERTGDGIVSFLLRDDAEVKKVADFDRREDAHPPTLVVETLQSFPLVVGTLGAGHVTLSPPGWSYTPGTVVTLTAVPDPGWRLEAWSGDVAGTANPVEVLMDTGKSVWAIFVPLPHHALALVVNGLGSVALDPPGGSYIEGTPVRLVATPEPGWTFDGWSGDLAGASSAATIVMEAPHAVTATFHSGPAAASPIVLQETVSGGSSGAASVSTATLVNGVDDELYLAAVVTTPFRSVSAITGLGLQWTLVREQCAGQGTTGISLWRATGPSAISGSVDVVLAGAANQAVVEVCRYSGCDPSQPTGVPTSGNANGSNGTCAGGTSSATYALDLGDPGGTGLVFGAVAHRASAHTPGSGWSERAEATRGSTGAAASLAVVDAALPWATGSVTLSGGFNAVVDWAAVAVPLRPMYNQMLALVTVGLGAVSLTPAGGEYPPGTLVALQAAAQPGWSFVGWEGDLSGARNPMSALVSGPVTAAARFSSVPHYDLDVEVHGGGRVVVTPDARRFAAGSMVSLAAEPRPGWIFTGWDGDANGSIPAATLFMQAPRSVGAHFQFAGAGVTGLWSSAAELAAVPMQGEAWDQVLVAANRDFYPPDVTDQNSDNNIDCLAAAIVFARSGQTSYRDRVVQALGHLAGLGNPGANTLAWGRELGAYVLAADLVGYRTAAFDAWLLAMAETYKGTDGRRLVEVLQERPNNWGMHAFGTLVAVYAYLHDDVKLAGVRDTWIQGVSGTPPQGEFGELSWQFDPARPTIINPARSVLHGLDVDGAIPDDMRRGGAFAIPPPQTDYPWGALQGTVMAARILERYDPNLEIWSIGEAAIYRAARLLQERWQQQFGGWAATGDDRWLLPFLDHAYGTHWSQGVMAELRAGKNAGWAYVLLGSTDPGTPSSALGAPVLSFRLFPSFPNPFARTANIRFSVAVEGPVRVLVYDATGRRVVSLLDRVCPAGVHTLRWEGVDAAGKPVARGIYWCQLQAGAHRESIRLTLLR